MKKENNVVIKKECHSRGMLSGIYNACCYHKKEKDLSNEYVEDPRLQHSGMTALFDTPLSPLQGTSKVEELFDNPPTPLRGTSPTRGAEKAVLCAKQPARGGSEQRVYPP